MFRVQPDMLRTSTRALSDVGEGSRVLDASRGEVTDQLSRAGSDPVRRSAAAVPRLLGKCPARGLRAGRVARRQAPPRRD